MSQIFDLGEVPFTPRAAAGAAAPSAAQLGAAAEASLAGLDADERRRLDGFVTMHPENGSQPVDPRFVGYDMVETTLRCVRSGRSVHAVLVHRGRGLLARLTSPTAGSACETRLACAADETLLLTAPWRRPCRPCPGDPAGSTTPRSRRTWSRPRAPTSRPCGLPSRAPSRPSTPTSLIMKRSAPATRKNAAWLRVLIRLRCACWASKGAGRPAEWLQPLRCSWYAITTTAA
jgi:hypothetical protein